MIACRQHAGTLCQVGYNNAVSIQWAAAGLRMMAIGPAPVPPAEDKSSKQKLTAQQSRTWPFASDLQATPSALPIVEGSSLIQPVLPAALVIVDGDPGSGEVRAMLGTHDILKKVPTWWIPSNHANLPYQRYLGYRAAKCFGEVQFLVYLDDDLRINVHAVW